MTIKEFQISLEQKVKNLKNFTAPLKIAAFTATAKMGERIFDEGKKEDGSPIGQYSTKPFYINPDVLKNMKVPGNIGVPKGKTGKTKFTTGKKKGERHKTKYLEGGYKELREKLGRQTAYVDLTLSDELKFDFGNDRTIAEPRKINELEYQIRLDKEINQKKREGLEEKYGTIFKVSDSEKELFFETMRIEFNRRLSAKA